MFHAALSILTPTLITASPRCLARHMSSLPRGGVGVVGAPFNKGQRREGVSKGPQVIRETGVLEHLTSLGLDVRDYGDVNDDNTGPDLHLGPDGERHHTTVLEYNRRLSSAVTRVVKEGRVCVTLGGDHSIAIGSVHGHSAANPDHQVVVLWVDAHADLNTGAISMSGNMHGMPVAHHLHAMDKQINKLPDGWPKPCLLLPLPLLSLYSVIEG
ncbi:Arginase-2, mitochondrial [Chionoecetes opilio]|uniref:Arginase-2, mitochondrial n=1 Tax=Chionoecetes opilio TaxID=41210 RepID=A0A8J4Y093_CHIOP|nr:Arginase-2, mitochondrial [Chionoecetes opilio]